MEVGQLVSSAKQREIQDLCLQLSSWNQLAAFPGSQPVTLDRYSLKSIIQRKKYFVSEKSDGFRHLLLILNNGVFLINSLFQVRSISPLRFPLRSNMAAQQNQTLLDGEIVVDRIDESGKTMNRFLIHDILFFNGNSMMKYKLPDRLKTIQNDVIWPRKNDTGPQKHDYTKEPLGIRLKDFYELRHMKFLVNDVMPILPHANEGLVFTPLDLPYLTGVNRNMFKWKPADLNSVDFQLGIEWRERKPGYKLQVMDNATRTLKDYSWITLSEEESAKVGRAEGKIIECVWEENRRTYIPKKGTENWEDGTFRNGGWRVHRIREDKKSPNDEQTVERVLHSIEDNITQDELVTTLANSDLRNSRQFFRTNSSGNVVNNPERRQSREYEPEVAAPPRPHIASSSDSLHFSLEEEAAAIPKFDAKDSDSKTPNMSTASVLNLVEKKNFPQFSLAAEAYNLASSSNSVNFTGTSKEFTPLTPGTSTSSLNVAFHAVPFESASSINSSSSTTSLPSSLSSGSGSAFNINFFQNSSNSLLNFGLGNLSSSTSLASVASLLEARKTSPISPSSSMVGGGGSGSSVDLKSLSILSRNSSMDVAPPTNTTDSSPPTKRKAEEAQDESTAESSNDLLAAVLKKPKVAETPAPPSSNASINNILNQ